MEQELEKTLAERFQELPPDVQKAILSEDLETALQEITTKYRLHIDQAGALGDETRLVMLGFADPGEFAEQLKEQLNIPLPQAESIAEEVSTRIFVPIRKSMQEFMEARAMQEALASRTAPSTTEKQVSVPSKVPEEAGSSTAPLVSPTSPPPTPRSSITADSNIKQPTPLLPPSIDEMLSKPTVRAPGSGVTPQKIEPPKISNYKTDPYREPVE